MFVMSVIFENEFGWLVCSAKAIRRNYQQNCQTVKDSGKFKTQDERKYSNEMCHSYCFKDELFKIHSPFMMDTQFEKLTAATKSKAVEDSGESCSVAQSASKKVWFFFKIIISRVVCFIYGGCCSVFFT